jgi:DNA helicase-2/ATP-dependent DNA helicase PcrA
MNYRDFISEPKSLLIAPAGYGKTYSLAECLMYTPDNKRQLVLTHTHAGIASIREKVNAMGVNSSKHHIETITGFAQKYVLALCDPAEIPPQEKETYFDTIIEKAIELLKLESVKRIIKYSYDGLFVDEYQDCSKGQHCMIMLLADVLPTHILGDAMQGIFDFKNTALVDFENDLIDFECRMSLETPWRWRKEGNNANLGESFKAIRAILDSDNKQIDLRTFPGFFYHNIKEKDIYQWGSTYLKSINELITNPRGLPELESLLLIVPDAYQYSNLNSRAALKSRIDYSQQLTLLEALDEKDYYNICKNIDRLIEDISNRIHKIKSLKEEVFSELFNKTEIKSWFGDNTIIKRTGDHKQNSLLLKNYIDSFIREPSILNIYSIILFMKNDLHLKTKRRELLNSILKAMQSAITEQTSVYEAMKQQKNRIRRVGRKIYGKCMGTTLLTKGLEFDTVVVLNAHRFESYKHFYVAITRACKKLIIFSEKPVLNF